MTTRLSPRLLSTLVAFALSAGAPVQGQPAYMVADLGDTVPYLYDLSSGPVSEHLEVDGKFYFFSDDGVHGRELWRSDGTALGTFLVRDLCPGTCGSQFPGWNGLAALGDRVVFAADDGVHGVELWISDGTALGTQLVADLRPGYSSSFIQTLTAAGDQVFFTAQRDSETSSLWRTDGTAKGTYPITPPGQGSSFSPTSIHSGPGFIYLCNADWEGQSGLWRSDGSSAGTTFVAAVGCWQNSIGKRGTMLVSPGGVLYFEGRVTSPGPVDSELWRSDGTLAGTWRVKDILPGPGGSSPSGLVFLGGSLLFRAEGLSGTELWQSDGTEIGTIQIPLADDAQPWAGAGATWTVADGRYFFVATDEAHGVEPWVYDGIAASRVADLIPGPGSSIVAAFPDIFAPYFETFGSEALFTATDGVFGTELWRTDGSEAGTVRISDIAPGPAGLHLPIYWSLLVSSLGGRPIVVEHQATTGERLWRLSASGATMELVDVLNAQTSSFERVGTDRLSLYEPDRGRLCFEAAGPRLFFERRRASEHEIDLLRTDGALSPPDELIHAQPWNDGSECGSQGDLLLYPQVPKGGGGGEMELVAIHALSDDSEVLLPAGASVVTWPAFVERAGRQAFGTPFSLHETDGTAAGTSLLATEVEEFGGRIDVFLGEIVEVGNALRITDAAEPAGARVLFEGDGVSTYPELDLAPLGSTLVFVAHDPAHGSELWTSDGTPEGTAFLVDSNPGPASAFRGVSADRYWELREPRLLGAGTYAVFAGLSAVSGEELWITDGTALGTGLLKDIYPGDYPSTPRQFTRLGDRIVFSAEDEEHGLELWVTDGTYPGTTLLKDVAPGLASSVPDDLVVRDGVLYFSAWSPSYGREAWKSDGTASGTVRISDVAPGPLSSSPQRFARAGNRLYFSATDQIHGYELWAISDDGAIPLFLDGFENESTTRWSEVTP